MNWDKKLIILFAFFILSIPHLAPGSRQDTDNIINASDCDITRGEKVFTKCIACHSLDAVESDLPGPNLDNLLGRKAGSVEGYKFSRSLRNSDLVWDLDTLHKFLENPQTLAPRNKMAFAGLKKKEDRDAVICHIIKSTE